MPRWLLVLALAAVGFLPSTVHAQGDVVLDSVAVRLWPEYDQPSLLVIYDMSVASTTAFPAALILRIPAGADLIAVARNDNGDLVNVQYDPPVRQGVWDAVTVSVSGPTMYRFEYYVPITKNGEARHFVYDWPADYEVDSFDVMVQEPLGATHFKTDPALQDTGVDQDGLRIFRATLKLLRGEAFDLAVDYQKSTDTLSASQLAVQPADSLDQKAAVGISFYNYLPGALAALGVILVVAAGVWYWNLGGAQGRSGPRRRRSARNSSRDAGRSDKQIYCHQCGRRAQPGDRFCRTCGTRLRLEE